MPIWWPDDEIIGDKIDRAKKSWESMTSNVAGVIREPILLERARTNFNRATDDILNRGRDSLAELDVQGKLSSARSRFDELTAGIGDLNQAAIGFAERGGQGMEDQFGQLTGEVGRAFEQGQTGIRPPGPPLDTDPAAVLNRSLTAGSPMALAAMNAPAGIARTAGEIGRGLSDIGSGVRAIQAGDTGAGAAQAGLGVLGAVGAPFNTFGNVAAEAGRDLGMTDAQAELGGAVTSFIAPGGAIGPLARAGRAGPLMRNAARGLTGVGAVVGSGLGAAETEGQEGMDRLAGIARRGVEGANLGANIPEMAQGLGRVAGRLGQNAAGRSGIVLGETERALHGTGTPYDVPDAGKFAEDGLYGPAYYKTTDPRVAGSYAQAGAKPVGREHTADILEDLATRAEQDTRLYADNPQARATLASWVRDEVDAIRGGVRMPDPVRALRQMSSLDDTPEWRSLVREHAASVQDTGQQIRPVDVPAGTRYLDIEKPLPDEEIEMVARRIDQERAPGWGDEFRQELEGYTVDDPDGDGMTTTGKHLYQTLQQAFGWKKPEINKFLSRAGFDGVTHVGGHIMPMMDDAGNPIEHRVFATFGESLPKLRNALSGRPMGIVASPNMGITTTERSRIGVDQVARRAETGRGAYLPYESRKGQGTEFSDSSYEIAAMQRLDDNEDVASWTKKLPPEEYRITWRDTKGNERSYMPDYAIRFQDGSEEILEIKPAWRLDDPDIQARVAAAREFARARGSSFAIASEDEIGRNYLREFDTSAFDWLNDAQRNELARRLRRVSASPRRGFRPGQVGARSMRAAQTPGTETLVEPDDIEWLMDMSRTAQERGNHRAAELIQRTLATSVPRTTLESVLTGVFGPRSTGPMATAERLSGPAGAALGAATADEDATIQERLKRAATGALLGPRALRAGADLAPFIRGEGQAILNRLGRLRVAGDEQPDLFNAADAGRLEELRVGMERRMADWESLSNEADMMEEELALAQEMAKVKITRPPNRGEWAMGSKRGLTEGDLYEIARRSDLNPNDPDWWQNVDMETLRLYKSEVLGERNRVIPETPAKQAQRMRARIKDVRRQAKELEQRIMQDVEDQSRFEDEMASRGIAPAPEDTGPPPGTPEEVAAEVGRLPQAPGQLIPPPPPPPRPPGTVRVRRGPPRGLGEGSLPRGTNAQGPLVDPVTGRPVQPEQRDPRVANPLPPERTHAAVTAELEAARQELQDALARKLPAIEIGRIRSRVSELRSEQLNLDPKGIPILGSGRPSGTPQMGMSGMPDMPEGRVFPESVEQGPTAMPGTPPPPRPPPDRRPGTYPVTGPMRQPGLAVDDANIDSQLENLDPGTPQAVTKIQQIAGWINQGRYINLLSGTASAFGDIVGNTINIPRLYGRTAGGAAIESAFGVPMSQRATTGSQITGLNRGMKEGSIQAVKEAWDVFMHGYSQKLEADTNATRQINPDIPTEQGHFRGKKWLPLTVGYRIRLAADALVTNVGERMATYSMGYREADRAGLKNGTAAHTEYAENVARHVQGEMLRIRQKLQPGERVPQGGVTPRRDPGSTWEYADDRGSKTTGGGPNIGGFGIDRLDYNALAKEAFTMSRDLAFQRELGTAAEAAASFRGQVPLMQAVVAFYRTSSRIAADMIQQHPVLGTIGTVQDATKAAFGHGPWARVAGERSSILARSRDAHSLPMSQRLADQAMGMMAATAGAALAANGVITALGPTDSSVTRRMMNEGWRPLSWVIPDGEGGIQGYIPLTRLIGPYAMSLGFGAALYEMVSKGESIWDARPQKLLTDFILAQEGQWSQQSGLRDIYELLNIPFSPDPEEAGRTLERMSANIIGQFVPLVGLQRQAAGAFDPFLRDPRNAQERVMQDLFFLRGGVDVRRTETGQEITRGPGETGLRSILPFQEVERIEAPRKFFGSRDAQQDAEITTAINAVNNWRRDPRQYREPTPKQWELTFQFRNSDSGLYATQRAEERKRRRIRAREEEETFLGFRVPTSGG